MYRLFFTFLATWALMVPGTSGQETPVVCSFDKIGYLKKLDLASLNGAWYQIRGTDNLPCINSSTTLVIDTTKNTMTFPAEADKPQNEYTFTHDKGVLTITDKKTSLSQQAVVISEKFAANSAATLYFCEVVDKTQKISARYLSNVKDVKLEDAKKVVEGIKDLKDLKWNWTEDYCKSSPADTPAASSAGTMVIHVFTVITALFISKM